MRKAGSWEYRVDTWKIGKSNSESSRIVHEGQEIVDGGAGHQYSHNRKKSF